MDAQIEKHKGNTEKQIELLRDIVKRDKASHAAYFELAKAYVTEENYELAQKNAEKATKLMPTHEWYNLTLADIYELSKQYKKASATYSNMITQFPKNPVIYHRLSVNQLRLNDNVAAANTLEKLQSITGTEEETSRRLFDIYSKSGNQEKALTTLRNLSSEYPDNIRYLNNLAGYLHDTGNTEEAEATFKKVIALDPQNTQANLALVRSQPRDAEASDYLSSLMPVMENMDIPLDNKIQELMPQLAEMEKGTPSAASLDEISKLLVELYPNEAKVYSVRGDVMFYSGTFNESQKMYAKAISLDDRKYPIWDQWMINLWQTNNYKKLETVSYDAIDLFPNKIDAFVMHALALNENNKQSEGLEFLDEALFIAGEKKSLINIIKISQSWIDKNATDKEPLKSILTKFEKNDFTNPIYFEIVGDLYARLKDSKKSKEYWQLAIDLGAEESKLKKKMGA